MSVCAFRMSTKALTIFGEVAARFAVTMIGSVATFSLLYTFAGPERMNAVGAGDGKRSAVFGLLVVAPVLETLILCSVYGVLNLAMKRVRLAAGLSAGLFICVHGVFNWYWAAVVAPLAFVSAGALVKRRIWLESAIVLAGVHFLFNLSGMVLGAILE